MQSFAKHTEYGAKSEMHSSGALAMQILITNLNDTRDDDLK